MIIGRISDDEESVRFNIDIHCTSCRKQVPGGMKTGKKYYQTEEFKIELEEFLKNYLCGICRDKSRRNV
ncbi:hypothetical protein K0U27_10670 [archaeon]|nr:hypothetical protein [archaeon]